MMMDVLKRLLLMLVFTLAHALVFHRIHVFHVATPLFYVYFVLLFPRSYPRWSMLLWCFFMGLVIDMFSNVHLLVFLAFCVMTCALYGLRRLMCKGCKIVHFNDIPSFYPTALCLLIASSAVLYSSIQLFGPETWRHFYYHPSLNPFALPFWLGVFIISVWAIIIVGIATIDDVTRMLTLGEAILYLVGLAAVCAVCYVVFSITTLYYIGYPLLIAYYVFALRKQGIIP